MYSHPYKCTECKSGYTLNENHLVNSFDKVADDLFFHLKFNREKYFDIVYNFPKCQKIKEIENCKEYDSEGNCQKC